MLSVSFQSHLIRHSGSGCTFKDTQSVLNHLRRSESTRAIGHSEGTWAAKALKHLDSQALRLLSNPGTWSLKHLET